MSFLTRSGKEFMLDSKPFKNIGFNYYPLIINFPSQANVEQLAQEWEDNGVRIGRTWLFINSVGSIQTVLGVPTLVWNQSVLDQLDMVLGILDAHGIKLVCSFADNTYYNTKPTVCGWSDTLYGTSLVAPGYPYVGFFNNTNCRNMYKQFLAMLAARYKDDDRIAYWELGNELRIDQFTSENGTQNTAASENLALMIDWSETMATYLKSLDTNHMVNFGAMSHTWQWTNGDSVSNGSGYGVDYRVQATSTVLDMVDYHCYPNQSGTELKKFGQRLGYPNTITGAGFKAQTHDYVRVAHANNKPIVCGEVGFDKDITGSVLYYPLHPRHNAFREYFHDFFDVGGNLLFIWHAARGLTSGGSYDVAIGATGSPNVNDNSNDTKTMSLVAQWNAKLRGGRIPLNTVEGISI